MPNEPREPDLFTVHEVAKRVDKTTDFVRRRDHLFKPLRDSRNTRLYTRESVERFLLELAASQAA